MSTVNTFLAVLFVLVFAIAVTSGGALKGSDAFVLRWAVLSLAVAVSVLVAWARWKMTGRKPATSPRQPIEAPTPPSAPPDRVVQVALAQMVTDAVARRHGRRIPDQDAPAILAASRQAIVFRQHFPPRHDPSTRSFFGGAPVAPSGFKWPRAQNGGERGKPFSFLMQVDCAAVPPAARLELLPDRGILYFFLDLTWGQGDPFRVLYVESGGDWRPVPPPDDLEYVYGNQAGSVWKWTPSGEHCPRLLPRWTFDPVAIEVPRPAAGPVVEDGDGAAALLWPGDKVTMEALRGAQGEDALSNPFSVKDLVAADDRMHRPFATYPHDWRAVQICCGLLLDRLRHEYWVAGAATRRNLSEVERDALVARLRDEARAWFNTASSNSPFDAVPQPECDRFWSWIATTPWLTRFVLIDALHVSIEASLSHSQGAAGRVPPAVARRVHDRHALAVRTERGVFVRTPDRMLAPPVDVQGNQIERTRTHLLLLELSSDEGLGHEFGEGVYQFWITPADLEARRFDKVELTTDAY
jgi:hypothetical protein